MHLVSYHPVRDLNKPSVKRAVDEKMRVLREFCVVNDKNAEQIRQKLLNAIVSESDHDYEMVLDRHARKLIAEKLNT